MSAPTRTLPKWSDAGWSRQPTTWPDLTLAADRLNHSPGHAPDCATCTTQGCSYCGVVSCPDPDGHARLHRSWMRLVGQVAR